ncbi:MAG: molecular chaperone DnaK [Planctomycetes bacterium]|nr:molecular chaperone DnaK [Planctomycetota bacterium]
MARTVGIDLGTTNSVIAVLEGDRPVVVPNADGSRTTPSVVGFTKEGERLVGQIAKRQGIMNPENTFCSVKRFMGRRWDEVDEESKQVPYRVFAGKDGAVRLGPEAKPHRPEEISAHILRKLAEDASRFLGEKVRDAVITVPAYFNDAQRQATKDAGTIAGLNVLRVINEPTASALAYGLQKRKDETILVFDLGGGTFDVSILDVGEGVFEVKATAGDTHLGGDDFDAALVAWLAEEFRKETGIDLRSDRQALQRLTEAAERAKCELSTRTETEINLPFITADANGPKHLVRTLTRAAFEALTEGLIDRCRIPVERALADAKLRASDIDEVILVGGSTRMPRVRELVRRLIGKEPNQSVHPDEAVALGAAIQGAILEGHVEDVVLLDVTPLSLGVETLGGVMAKIVERNARIPCRKSQVFSTAEDDQSAVDIVVVQGEREMARDNRILGQFRLEGIRPGPRGTPQIEVAFDIDANGILHATARDRDTGKEQSISVTNTGTLSKEDVDRLVREAQAHAADDKRRREQAEARNELDAAAHAVAGRLRQAGGEVPAHERARAEELLARASDLAKDPSADAAEARRLAGDLRQIEAGLTARAGAARQPGEGAGGEPGVGAGSRTGPGDDVIDADFSVR